MTRREPTYEPPAVYDWRQLAHRNKPGRPLTVHAFEPEGGDGQGSVSFCGTVPRSAVTRAVGLGAHPPRAGTPVCGVCLRVAAGRAPLYYGHNPATLPATGQVDRVARLDRALEVANLVIHASDGLGLQAALAHGTIAAADLTLLARVLTEVADRRPR